MTANFPTSDQPFEASFSSPSFQHHVAVSQESLWIDSGDGHQLHLRHLWTQTGGEPVLMLHGAIENGRIFYTHSGKGLASHLARAGFDVYVADLKGRGECKPKITPGAEYGQTESICNDLPKQFDFVWKRSGNQRVHLIGHSWGGVLLASMMARFPKIASRVASKVCFGTKRSISVFNLEKFLKVSLFWNWLGIKIAHFKGYLPAKALNCGSDNETVRSLEQSSEWVMSMEEWVDSHDGFDYNKACHEVKWPPVWHIAAVNDRVLGHPTDVRRFMLESKQLSGKLTVLSKRNGNRVDYDHINMLTHPDAVYDHFRDVVSFLRAVRL